MSQVSPTLKIPLNSVYVTLLFVVLLSLINLGSSVAYTQVISLGVAAMLTSYIISISCIALKRIRGKLLLPSKFNLGRWGLPVNIISIVFLVYLWVFSFFPAAPHPRVADMNWAVLGYGTVIIFAVLYYLVRGWYNYVGPVEYVRKGR